MKKLAIIPLLIILHACDNGDPSVEPGVLKVRIQNATSHTLENISVNTSGGIHIYSKLEPWHISPDAEYDFAYSYANISFTIRSKVFTFQPIDFFGEDRYEEGLLIYRIEITDFDKGQFSIEAIHK
ncbi:hypothetical protein [Chryseolinea sp. H1M3-3]|uniref:hypothetical protein n=1 Tax=Chryseolinea sp. H1M3-3 TaxID=3034144 RepID=UPI0023ED344E|nr:hypothetical protein [Chryseolinea sp. H1M3-3]